MTNIGNDKVDTSREMEAIDGTAKYPWLAFKSERVKSFWVWPEDVKQRPELLAECGFFYFREYKYQYLYHSCPFLTNQRPGFHCDMRHITLITAWPNIACSDAHVA